MHTTLLLICRRRRYSTSGIAKAPEFVENNQIRTGKNVALKCNVLGSVSL